jgi:hypothetical protein
VLSLLPLLPPLLNAGVGRLMKRGQWQGTMLVKPLVEGRGGHVRSGECCGISPDAGRLMSKWEQVEERFQDHRARMGLLELGVMLWAFAKAGHLCSRIFEAAVPTIMEQCAPPAPLSFPWSLVIPRCSCHSLPLLSSTSIHWAPVTNPHVLFQLLSRPSTRILTAGDVLPCLNRQHLLDKQSVSMVAWSFATAGHANSDVFAACSSAILADHTKFDMRVS